jgi:hypothetical protein
MAWLKTNHDNEKLMPSEVQTVAEGRDAATHPDTDVQSAKIPREPRHPPQRPDKQPRPGSGGSSRPPKHPDRPPKQPPQAPPSKDLLQEQERKRPLREAARRSQGAAHRFPQCKIQEYSQHTSVNTSATGRNGVRTRRC